MYAVNTSSANVTVIDLATNTPIATITVGLDPQQVAVSPDGTTVYVTNGGAGTVSVINTATNTVTGTINCGVGAFGINVSADGKTYDLYLETGEVVDWNDLGMHVVESSDGYTTVTIFLVDAGIDTWFYAPTGELLLQTSAGATPNGKTGAAESEKYRLLFLSGRRGTRCLLPSRSRPGPVAAWCLVDRPVEKTIARPKRGAQRRSAF